MPASAVTPVRVPVLARTRPRPAGGPASMRALSDPVNPATGRPSTTARRSGRPRLGGQAQHVDEQLRLDPVGAGQPAAVVAARSPPQAHPGLGQSTERTPARPASIEPARSGREAHVAQQHLGGLVVADLEDALHDLAERGAVDLGDGARSAAGVGPRDGGADDGRAGSAQGGGEDLRRPRGRVRHPRRAGGRCGPRRPTAPRSAHLLGHVVGLPRRVDRRTAEQGVVVAQRARGARPARPGPARRRCGQGRQVGARRVGPRLAVGRRRRTLEERVAAADEASAAPARRSTADTRRWWRRRGRGPGPAAPRSQVTSLVVEAGVAAPLPGVNAAGPPSSGATSARTWRPRSRSRR